jgi:hypothetical protein
MENQTVTSPKFAINWKDSLRGLLVSVGTAVLVIVQNSLDAGDLKFNWKQIGIAAVAAGVTYLVKNFFTPASLQIPISNEAAKLSEDPKSAK